jgi:hypothetical protein
MVRIGLPPYALAYDGVPLESYFNVSFDVRSAIRVFGSMMGYRAAILVEREFFVGWNRVKQIRGAPESALDRLVLGEDDDPTPDPMEGDKTRKGHMFRSLITSSS